MSTFCCIQLFYRFAPTNVICKTVFGLSVDTPPTCAKIPYGPPFLYHEVMRIHLMLRNSQDHMRKIRKRKLNHLFTNVPLTIPQIFHSSHRVNIQLDNKQVFYEKKLHLNERNYNTHRIRQNLPTVSNSKCPLLNNLNNKLCQ